MAQDLPPDVLADQYLLEAAKAMQEGDARTALRAFEKIEALDVEPPMDFLYFYGKLLVEHGARSNDIQNVQKGQSFLKLFVINLGRDSEHYTSALELLSQAESNLEEIPGRLRQEEERKEKARKEEERKRRIRKCENWCAEVDPNVGIPCRRGERCRCSWTPCSRWHRMASEDLREKVLNACSSWLDRCRSACSTYDGATRCVIAYAQPYRGCRRPLSECDF